MALNANALIELAPAKTFIKVPSAKTDHDSLIEDFINSCSTLIEKYCDRIFRAQDLTERRNGGLISTIVLHQWPVNSVASLHVDNDRVFGTDTLVDPSNYEITSDQAGDGYVLERFDAKFPDGSKNVKIVYNAGYADYADVPADIQLACKIAVGFYYKQQQEEIWIYSNKQKGEENMTVVQGLPEAATQILDNYKRLEMLAPVEPVRNI